MEKSARIFDQSEVAKNKSPENSRMVKLYVVRGVI